MKQFPDNPHLKGTREDFLNNNYKLAYKVAQRYRRFAEINRIDMADIVGNAFVGLVKAYDKYDPTKFEEGFVTKFSTYAFPKMLGEIQRFIRDDGAIRVPRTIKDLVSKMLKEGMTPETPWEEIVIKFEVSEKFAKDTLGYMAGQANPSSLEHVVFQDEGSDIVLGDMVGVETDLTDNIFINEFFESLDERDRKVAKLYYVDELGQAEIGVVLGVSQAHVSRILVSIKEYAEAFKNGYKGAYKRGKQLEVRKISKPEERKRMLSEDLKELREQATKLLQDTELTYKEIGEKLGLKYNHIAALGKQVRTPEQRKKIVSNAAKKQMTERRANEKAKREELKEKAENEKKVVTLTPTFTPVPFVNEEPKIVLSSIPLEKVTEYSSNLLDVGIKLNSENATIQEIEETFEKALRILKSTNAKNVTKFKVKLIVQA